LTVALLAAWCPAAWSELVGPNAQDRQIALAMIKLLEKDHLSRHPLDKEISERAFTLFFKNLDPMKLYFYQSDMDEFAKYKDQLSSMLLKGDVSFAYTVFRTMLHRVDERMKLVDELLATPHDFTVDEEVVFDRDKLQYPKTPDEARDRWRKRIKYDLLVLKLDKKEGQEAADKLKHRYGNYARWMHQTDSSELLEMYLNAFARSYDPHSDYMSPDTQKNLDIMMSLELEGIGAVLTSEDGYIIVKELVPGGAADKNGQIKVEDKIVGVGQNDDGEMVDVVEMKLKEVVKLIRGKRGTTVRLNVIPTGGGPSKTIKIAREKIELKDSEAHGQVFDAGRKPDGSAYRIGVIELPSFYMDMAGARRGIGDFKSATRDVRNILDDFKKQGVEAVVLDLRRNGGGALSEAITLTGLFITEGPVVQKKGSDGRVQVDYDTDSHVAWSGPLVVVISKFSASASEILAGAIQDYGRGLIVGDHSTHGKGTVQSLVDLGQRLFGPSAAMGAMKVTLQQFYRPNGDSTQKRGVLADVELPSFTTHFDGGEADLDYPVEFDRVKALNFKRQGDVSPALCQQLQQTSQQRVQGSENFQKLTRNIARFEEQKSKKTVALQEAKFMKERAELNADKEEEEAYKKMNDTKNRGIERDFYLDEILAVTADYMNLESAAKTPMVQSGEQRVRQ
jgi:carboxyl-terminal processing protease